MVLLVQIKDIISLLLETGRRCGSLYWLLLSVLSALSMFLQVIRQFGMLVSFCFRSACHVVAVPAYETLLVVALHTRVFKLLGAQRYNYCRHVAGRNRINSDGSREFDWEGSQVFINIQNASSVIAQITSDAGTTRLVVAISPLGSFNWTEYGAVWVAPGAPTNVTVAAGLPSGSWTIRLFNDIEPSAEGTYGNVGIRFQGFSVAGTVLPAGPFSSRRIEWVGDSITVGYGSIGVGPCQASDVTSSNWNTYDRMICDHFAANCELVQQLRRVPADDASCMAETQNYEKSRRQALR